MKISQRVAGVEYAIRDIALEARKLQKQGKKITYLNIGDPLQYGFQPPDRVKEAFVKAIKEGQNYYASSEGLPELRQAIAKKEAVKGLRVLEDDVLVTNGVSEGLEMIMASIVETGDEVLIPGPYYPPYASYVRLFGGKPIEFLVDLH
ncbi:MAG: aminotransferase class I/II-fold pyridoxal phosphate-dependent enzyme, partial [Nitrosotalea sp.]